MSLPSGVSPWNSIFGPGRRSKYNKASGYGTLPHPVVIDGCQQGDKHVRQPQVHFVGQSINSGRLLQPDRLQCFSNLLLLYAPLTPSRFSHRKAREVGKIGVELSRAQSRLPGEKFQKILPELPTDGFVCSSMLPIRRCDTGDMPICRMPEFLDP